MPAQSAVGGVHASGSWLLPLTLGQFSLGSIVGAFAEVGHFQAQVSGIKPN